MGCRRRKGRAGSGRRGSSRGRGCGIGQGYPSTHRSDVQLSFHAAWTDNDRNILYSKPHGASKAISAITRAETVIQQSPVRSPHIKTHHFRGFRYLEISISRDQPRTTRPSPGFLCNGVFIAYILTTGSASPAAEDENSYKLPQDQ